MLSLLIPILLWSLPPGIVPVTPHPTEFSLGMALSDARDLLDDKGWAREVRRDDVLVDGRPHHIVAIDILNHEPHLLVFEDGVCVRVSR